MVFHHSLIHFPTFMAVYPLWGYGTPAIKEPTLDPCSLLHVVFVYRWAWAIEPAVHVSSFFSWIGVWCFPVLSSPASTHSEVALGRGGGRETDTLPQKELELGSAENLFFWKMNWHKPLTWQFVPISICMSLLRQNWTSYMCSAPHCLDPGNVLHEKSPTWCSSDGHLPSVSTSIAGDQKLWAL